MPIITTFTGSINEPEELIYDPTGIGIVYPFNTADGLFQSTYTTFETVRSNLKLLLDTEPGERVMMPDWGVPLRKYLFEQITDDIKLRIKDTVTMSVKKWIPEASIISINITDKENKLIVNMKFGVLRDYETTADTATHRSI